MSTESFLAVTAASWGVAMGLSPILQIRQMLATRSSRDVSIGYFVVLDVGFVLWASYGLSIPNLALAIPNVVALCAGTVTIAIALRLRAAEPDDPASLAGGPQLEHFLAPAERDPRGPGH